MFANTTEPNVNRTSVILKFYNKYEHLASTYAKQIFNYERYGYEKADIVQEFKIKLYTSIISYAEKLQEYKETGKYKPVPIEFYLKSAMVNKVKDFVRKFNTEDVANTNKISIQDNNFDYSVYNDMASELDLKNHVCVINGVDLLENLALLEKFVFVLYLKGHTIREIKRKFKKVTDPSKVIEHQINYLKTKHSEIYDRRTIEYKVFSYNEDTAK
jgi:hypothetical protein